MWIFLSIVTLLVFHTAPLHCQTPVLSDAIGSCAQITIDDLGTTDSLSAQGLVVDALFTLNQPMVRILRFERVCEASGLLRNTSTSISVVVEYECMGCQDMGAPNNTVITVTEQFQFVCDQDFFEGGGSSFTYDSGRFAPGILRTPSPTAMLTTGLEDQCGLCADPAFDPLAEQDTHCRRCSGACNEGQRRCVGVNADQCCNWYLNDRCVVTCPAPLVGDSETYDCGCGELDFEDGTTSYTDRFLVGSVATHSCDEGFMLSGPFTNERNCTTNGWTSNNQTCTRINFPTADVVTTFTSPSPITPPSSTPLLVSVAIALGVVSIITFFIGTLAGAYAHHLWLRRQERKKSPEKMASSQIAGGPPIYTTLTTSSKDDTEPSVYTSLVDANAIYNEVEISPKNRDSLYAYATPPSSSKLGGNNSFTTGPSLVGHRPTDATLLENATDSFIGSTTDRDVAEDYTTSTVGRAQAFVQLKENVAYNSVTARGVAEDYTASTGRPRSGETAVQLKENVAYNSTSNRDQRNDIPLQGNVAYTTHMARATNQCCHTHISDPLRVETKDNGEIPIVGNVAYVTHRGTEATNQGQRAPRENGDYISDALQVETKDGKIPTTGNVAYITHRGTEATNQGQRAPRENGDYISDALRVETKEEKIHIAGNAAYATHRGTEATNQGEIDLVTNEAYSLGGMVAEKAISFEDNISHTSHTAPETNHSHGNTSANKTSEKIASLAVSGRHDEDMADNDAYQYIPTSPPARVQHTGNINVVGNIAYHSHGTGINHRQIGTGNEEYI